MSEKPRSLVEENYELALAYDLLSKHVESGSATTSDLGTCLKELVVVTREELDSSRAPHSSEPRKSLCHVGVQFFQSSPFP